MRIRLRTSKACWECGTFQPENLGTMGLMSTLEEIEAAVQQLPPAKRDQFREWFLSFDASGWDQQMEDDMTTGKLDWLTNEASRKSAILGLLSFSYIRDQSLS